MDHRDRAGPEIAFRHLNVARRPQTHPIRCVVQVVVLLLCPGSTPGTMNESFMLQQRVRRDRHPYGQQQQHGNCPQTNHKSFITSENRQRKAYLTGASYPIALAVIRCNKYFSFNRNQRLNMQSPISKLVFALSFAAGVASSQDKKLNTAQIDELTGLKGKLNEQENVYKVSSPRTDLKISVDQWEMPPFMGLTSWAAFTPGMKEGAMVMGDLVLMQDEVNPVMTVALDNGLEVTALHNHFFYDEPKVYFMHIGGEGSTDQLAKGVRAALDTVRKVRAANPQPAKTFGRSIPAQSSITVEALQDILGAKGEIKDGMFKAVFGRTVKMPCGCTAGKEMGVNTWAAFAGTDDNAVVDGDFVVLADELQPTLKSLRTSGINIVAIHHHMVAEEPRMIFFHYWGRGPAKGLANSVKSALALTKTKS